MNGGSYFKAKEIFAEIIKEIENIEIHYLQLDKIKRYLDICENKYK